MKLSQTNNLDHVRVGEEKTKELAGTEKSEANSLALVSYIRNYAYAHVYTCTFYTLSWCRQCSFTE